MKLRQQEQHSTRPFVVGALAGGLVGIAAALLLAPKSGKELRKDLANGCQSACDEARDFGDKAFTRGYEAVAAASKIAQAVRGTKRSRKNHFPSPSQLLLGALGGGLLGAAAFAVATCAGSEKNVLKDLLQKFTENGVGNLDTIFERISSSSNNRTLQDAMKWAVVGLRLWKKIQNRGGYD